MIARLLTARRAARARAASDAYILDIAARCARDERARMADAFERAYREMQMPRLTTETILDGYLAAVTK